MSFQIEEINKEYSDIKTTITNVIKEHNIIEFSVKENTFTVKIKDSSRFMDILRLFYYDKKRSKLKKAILHCAPIYSAISKNSEHVNLKFALITLTPEDRFTECAHYEDFIKQLFNSIHIGMPESVAEEFLKFNYFSTHITDEILNYQLKKLIENLKA